MNTKFYVKKGIHEVNDLAKLSGIYGVCVNPNGEGVNVIELIHDLDPSKIISYVNISCLGEIILVKMVGRKDISKELEEIFDLNADGYIDYEPTMTKDVFVQVVTEFLNTRLTRD